MSVHVIATGGTIASHHDGSEWHNLTGPELVAELDPHLIDTVGGLVVHDVAAGPSSQFTTADMASIARSAAAAIDNGASGVVVTHGTDTMDLTAFATQLLLGTSPDRPPVVFTGSMRAHSHPRPDGPANLHDAITVASHPRAVGHPVMVCLEGTVHRADHVHKRSAASVDAFGSEPFAPHGTLHGGHLVLTTPDGIGRTPATGLEVDVPLVTCFPGIDAARVAAYVDGAAGFVIEGYGDLNIPDAMWHVVYDATQRGALVVVASRVFTPTSRNEALDLFGAIGAGGLSAPKARLAVAAALATHPTSVDDALQFVADLALVHDAGDRSTR